MSLTYTSLSDKESFLRQNYIGTSDSLSFDDFLDFVVARRTALKNQFMNMLNVSSVPNSDEDLRTARVSKELDPSILE